MTEPLIEMLPAPVEFLAVDIYKLMGRYDGNRLWGFDQAELFKLLSRWVSEEEPVLVIIGTGAWIGLGRAGEEHLDPLPIYVRVSIEYQFERARIVRKTEQE